MGRYWQIARRGLGLIILVVGLAVAVLVWLAWLNLTLLLREGITTPLVLLPPAIVLIGFVAVIAALIRWLRHPKNGMAVVNAVVWSSSFVAYVLLWRFGGF